MKSHDILFKISPTEYFTLQLPWQENYLEKWDRIDFVYHSSKHMIHRVGAQYMWFLELIIYLQDGLNKALNNKIQITPELDDLGIKWNDYLNEESIHDKSNPQLGKTLSSYLLCESPENTLWIYNKNDKIYLHITPIYFWHFLDHNDDSLEFKYGTIRPPYITYEEFRTTYKPIATIEVSRALIQEWLTMVNHFFDIINTNYKKISSLNDEQVNQAGPYGTFVSTPVESVKENITDDPIVHPCFHHRN